MTTKNSKANHSQDEYYLLIEKLDEITWALDGKCNDIDCDKYMYFDLLQKKYRGPLKHSFSCIPNLKRDKEAVMHLLSLVKFKKYRFQNCEVCKKKVDTLGKNYGIVSFTRPSSFKGRKVFEHLGVRVHKKCRRSVKTPLGWNKS